MKKFIQNFKDSLLNKEFYQNLIKHEESTGFSYLFKLAILSAFVVCIYMICFVYFFNLDNKIRNQITQILPPDLVLTIDKNGELSVNKPVPYVIPTPDFLIDENNKEKERKNFITIYPEKDPTSVEFKTYDTMIFVSKDRFFVERDINGEIRSYPLKDWSGVTISRAEVLSVFDTLYNRGWIIILLGMIPFTIVYMFISFFISVISGFILFLLFRKSLTYKKALLVAIHAFTISFVFNILISILKPAQSFFWWQVLITVIAGYYFIGNKHSGDVVQS